MKLDKQKSDVFISTAKMNEPCSTIKDTAVVVKYILADHRAENYNSRSVPEIPQIFEKRIIVSCPFIGKRIFFQLILFYAWTFVQTLSCYSFSIGHSGIAQDIGAS